MIRISANPLLGMTLEFRKMDVQVPLTPDGILTTKMKASRSHSAHSVSSPVGFVGVAAVVGDLHFELEECLFSGDKP